MRFLALEEKKLEEQRMQREEQRQQKELVLHLPDLVDKCVNHSEQRITIFTCLDI